MPTLDDVYRKFGETAEAAQLLETQLGNLLLQHDCIDADLLENPDPIQATAIYDRINRKTLGQLIHSLGSVVDSVANVEQILSDALVARNRLTHSFYLRHNLRRNSNNGREIMLRDLDTLHDSLLEAYKAVLLLSGVDLDQIVTEQGEDPLPSGYLPMRT
ncbi:MAG: hypothetical protein F4171_09170 [Gammaproteobacteria bacterium]|nr:hypothetical protein [Gammaproteobacteria bacterium]